MSLISERVAQRFALPGLVIAGIATFAAACGGDTGSTKEGLTPQIAAAGNVRVAIDPTYPPMDFLKKDGKTITGFDHELGQLLSKKLGVPFQFINIGFDGIIPALKARRVDLVLSAMNDTPARRKVLDFVDYLNVGNSIVVTKGNPEGIATSKDLCGKAVAVQKATTQVDFAAEVSTRCEDAGRPPLEVQAFPKNTDALLQVKSGRADANLSDSPVAVYTAETSGGGSDFDVVDTPLYKPLPYGIGMLKGQDRLLDAVAQALQALIDDGTYERLVAKYDLSQGALKKATINQGG